MARQVRLERTKRGFSAVWEEGGNYGKSGEAIVVAGPYGEPLRYTFRRYREKHPCGKHAMMIVSPGTFLIRYHWDLEGDACEVHYIADNAGEGKLPVAYKMKNGKWWPKVFTAIDNSAYAAAFRAAREKSLCKYCCAPHWIRWDKKEQLCINAREARLWRPSPRPQEYYIKELGWLKKTICRS